MVRPVPGTLKLFPFFTVHASPRGVTNKDGSEGLLCWPFVDDAPVIFPECEIVGRPLSLLSLGSTRVSRRSGVVTSEALLQSGDVSQVFELRCLEKRTQLNIIKHQPSWHFRAITSTLIFSSNNHLCSVSTCACWSSTRTFQKSSTWVLHTPESNHFYILKLYTKGKSESTTESNIYIY